ncbi:MAG TPA: hypothetical protein DCQ84_01375, partial [Candidatus Competibacteraceae bacterium]|nr:hypothetical protein [Candidatus Competibacteraceae bacterium]
GWLVHGPGYTVCVVANVFCLLDNRKGSVNDLVGFMCKALAAIPSDMI